MKISVIGLGYVGLVTALTLSTNRQFDVVGIDIDKKKASSFNAGEIPIFEAGLSRLLNQGFEQAKIREFFDFHDALGLDAILTVGTPQRDDGSTDCDW